MREIPTPVLEPYRPRTIRFHGVREREDWRIKLYSISDDATEPAWADFAAGIASAERRILLRLGPRGDVARAGCLRDDVADGP